MMKPKAIMILSKSEFCNIDNINNKNIIKVETNDDNKTTKYSIITNQRNTLTKITKSKD